VSLDEPPFLAREPSVSVVVAAWPDTSGLDKTLAALGPQRDPATEVIVVSPAPRPPDCAQRFPWALWVEAPEQRLIPELWSLGMTRSRGEVVAITTSHFTPSTQWLAVIRDAHARLRSPAIGGPIEPPAGGSPADWATYFLRYSAYLRYDREQGVPDLAGDNASYRRAAIEAHPEFLREGFWELRFHERLRAAGETLTFVPAMRVRQHASFGFRRFVSQRLRHGREFGEARVRGKGPALRAAAVLASPLVPLILLGKVVLRVARSGRHLGPFLLALPILLCFVSAWGVGEAAGYLLGRPGPARPAGGAGREAPSGSPRGLSS
jgi:hypothetical protein